MLPAVCEFLADETDAVEVGSHCELFIFNLLLLCRSEFLRQCLAVESEGENNVASYLTRMQLAVETPELDRMVARKKAVQVKKVVSA